MIEKRRRKKVRTLAESSSEESGSENEVSKNDSDSQLSELSDVEETHDLQNTSNQNNKDTNETPRYLLHKAPKNSESQDFNQVFLGMVTQQFGEELTALRESNDFGAASITQLVSGLKQGVDIFSNDQRAMLK